MKPARTPELAAAYAFCRGVAKREAKNFYWAFRALPAGKSDAMCAVYAFMRKADDLSDDESMTSGQRRLAMSTWTQAWRDSRTQRDSGPQPATEPLFLALNDTQLQFGISDHLLEQLVAGTTTDLQPALPGTVFVSEEGIAIEGTTQAPGEYLAYRTFDDLYQYCYLVASVVGLVTIRIFGYRDPAAEKLAEHTGIAFQLTNILRDVREDAERGRVYLPLGDLERHGCSLGQLLSAAGGGAASPQLMSLLREEIDRAQEFYRSGFALVPLIDADAQPAMRVLIAIYHRLLQRIEADPAAVLRGRVRVPTAEKLGILARGVAGSLLARRSA